NQGQICSATSRIYVQDTIYEKFVEALKAESQSTSHMGDPFDDKVDHGPQVNETQYKKIMSYIEEAKKQGIRLVLGGNAPDKKGFYIEPTIFADVPEDAKIMREEVFGPVVVVSKFSTEEEAVKLANNSEYGLGA